jgi:hypothetical protein
VTASALTASLTGSNSGYPVHIWTSTTDSTVADNGFNLDLVRSSIVEFDTIRIEETGSHEGVRADFEIVDLTFALAAMRGEWPVRINKVGGGLQDDFFLGFMRESDGRYEARYGGKVVTCVDFSSLLDRDQVKTQFKIKGGTNAKAAIQQCFNTMTICYQFLGGAGMDWSKVRADLGEDGSGTFEDDIKFEVGLSLRQCIERILGETSPSANYRMDTVPRLWTWDASTQAAALLSAPYDVNVAHSPSGSEIAPEDFQHFWDSNRRISAVTIDGAKAAGSGTYADKDLLPAALQGTAIDVFAHRVLPGPWSADLWGESHAPLTGQPSVTQKQAVRLARAALGDLRNPIPTGSFTARQDSCYNGSTRWAGGQLVYVTSAAHGLNGRSADAGPYAGQPAGTTPGTRWALQPFRISRVTTEFVNGAGDLKQQVEYGGRRPHLSTV